MTKFPVSERLANSEFVTERGRHDVVLWDVLPITDGETIRIVFESSHSPWRQGVWLGTDCGLLVNGHFWKTVRLWMDNSPSTVECVCHSSDGRLHVYNQWDRGLGPNSQAYSSGMLVEDLPNGRRYRCNDIGFDSEFDKIVFRIERT